MKIAISQMTALAMLDATPDLRPALRDQILAVNPKADQLYLDAEPSDLSRGLEGIRSFIASGARYNREAYRYIEAELESLVEATA